MPRGALALLLSALVLTGCNRFSTENESRTAEPETASVGARLDLGTQSPPPTIAITDTDPEVPTSVPAAAAVVPPASDTSGTVSPTPPSAPGEPLPANKTVVLHESGFELSFVIADQLEFGPRDQIVFELVAHNTTDTDLMFETNQLNHFFIYPSDDTEPVWADRSCGGGPVAVPGSAQAVRPGESIRFVSRYPSGSVGEESSNAETCRVAPGTYRALGAIEWCPPGTLEPTPNGVEVCNRSKNVLATTPPINFRITP